MDVNIWFKDLHALCTLLYFFFSHASTMDLLFPILSLLSFSGFNLASLLTTAYMTIYILFLRYFSYFTVWKIRFTFQSPISGGGGTLSLHHCLSRPLTCKHILQSFSTLGLYPPTEKPIYNQRWVFFFFFSPLMHLIILNHLWNNPRHMLRKENLYNFVTWYGGHMEYHLLM